jgi:hypothetical protein
VAKKQTKDKKLDDTQNLGLFKETLSVMFGLNEKTINRVMAIVSNSEDKLNVKTYITRDKAGPRAVAWLRKAIEYARHEGSAKHEDDNTDFELTKDFDLEATARQERPRDVKQQPQDDVPPMENMKDCTFKDYLIEFAETEAEAKADEHRDIEMKHKNPDRYYAKEKQEAIDAKRDAQKSGNAQKMRAIDARLRANQEEEKARRAAEQEAKAGGL